MNHPRKNSKIQLLISDTRYLWTLYVLIASIVGTYAACVDNQFECDDGHCISRLDQCDGQPNCPDSSDETAQNCIHQRDKCPSYSFLCTYGGCISGNARCNGKVDCPDKSDETFLRCANDVQRKRHERNLQGNCAKNEIKCPSGICINNDHRCDGKDDCGDGYDESVDLCSHMGCPGYAFTCGYGACIANTKKCDEKIDCYDGSDESPLMCGSNRTFGVVTKPVVIDIVSNSDGCPLPISRERPLVLDRFGISIPEPILRGDVTFKCEKNTVLVGEKNAYCFNRQWSVEVPKCIKYCDPSEIIAGYSTVPACRYKGQDRDCKQKHPPGTEVAFSCATYFTTYETIPKLTCLPDGTWSGKRRTCSAECGQIASEKTEFSLHGIPASNRVVPWHVAIYEILNEVEFRFTCGGTLLSPDLVVTAAHCVWSEANFEAYDPHLFQVAASKYHRDYNIIDPGQETRNISQVIVQAQYMGKKRNFENDIALLKLDRHISFSDSIRPICYKFFVRSEKETLSNNVNGRFGAWDITGNHTFEFVQGISKSNQQCSTEYRLTDLGNDKICLEIDKTTRSQACRGDSGSGFVSKIFSSHVNDPERFHLFGIISNAHTGDQCASGPIGLTNIQYYQDFLESEIRRDRTINS